MKFNQKGFGAIEVLLVIIAVTLIVGVGFYVMNANDDKDENANASQNSMTTSDKPTKMNKKPVTFEFAELKVSVPKADLNELIYTKSTLEGLEGYYVATQAFKDLAAKCGENPPSGLYVYSKEGQYPGQGQEGFNGLVKQFSDGYIAYGDGVYGNIGCDETTYSQLSDMQEDVAAKLKAAFADAKELQ